MGREICVKIPPDDLFFFSLDKELIRLVEEKKIKESAEMKTKQNTNNIQVKPVIETVASSKITSISPTSPKMSINEKIDDLLR